MGKNKIGVIFLILVLLLAGTGLGYATWSQNVDIQATATTGNFNFQIYNIVVEDLNGATLIERSWDSELHEWTIKVKDVSPGWKGWFTVTHKNAGTVPLKFNTFQIRDLNSDKAVAKAYILKFYTGDYADPGTVNIEGSLWDFRTLQDYDSWLGGYEIKMPAGEYHDSLISLELDESITGYYNYEATFTFRMTAIQTTI